MKKGWKVKKLSEICLINPKKNEIKSKLNDADLVSFLPMNDLGIQEKNVIPKQTKRLEEVYKGYTYFADNDILLAKVTPCFENGKLGVVNNLINGFGFGSSEYIVLRTLGDILPEYLFYFLSTKQFREKGSQLMFGACGLKRLSKDYVDNTLIKYPSLSEQQRIVKVLDIAFAKIDTIKQNAEHNLQNAKELFQSLVDEELSLKKGWNLYKLSQICTLITDGTHSTPKYTDNGIPFLSVKNLTKGFIDFSDTRFISEVEHLSLTKRCKPEKNDILYTKVGTTGIAKVIDTEREFSIFVSVALLKIKHEIIYNYYLEHALNSPNAKKQAKKRTRGTANKNLVITDIKEITVPVPPIAEQHQIVTKLDTLSAKCKELENNYRQTITDCDEMKKSILVKAFNGEL